MSITGGRVVGLTIDETVGDSYGAVRVLTKTIVLPPQ